ncbi:hypothetical protein HMPREF0201_01346 [Cedecea davisae DSM 4568]|uniref:Uncharacterized protein n=1 Tax=Cedecea davisae DSM 4568 TaxID=566551 RepID=S3J201_9ENTR|nr:hypothetical protein HMPREF0201_01346 [Cedecea davisae DSM 4568]
MKSADRQCAKFTPMSYSRAILIIFSAKKEPCGLLTGSQKKKSCDRLSAKIAAFLYY